MPSEKAKARLICLDLLGNRSVYLPAQADILCHSQAGVC